MKHPYFGDLRSDAGVLAWDGVIDVAGRPVPVDLECEEDVSPAQLDLAARFPLEVARFDRLAREALDLDEDEDGVSLYVEHHRHVPRISLTREQFLAKLVLARIWFVPDDDDEFAVFDYSIDPDATDEVLAVRFDARGNFVSIACER